MLEIDSVGKNYRSGAGETEAIRSITFTVEQSEFVSVVGPSGCGKTTLLKCISGLLQPSRGSVRFRGQPVSAPPEGLALVFQDYAQSLFPWFSVRGNVQLPVRGVAKQERQARVDAALEAVGLAQFGHYYPWQLSGGMQQRVAIARALACRPSLLVMDEPFASVDAQTRAELEDLVLKVRREFDMTTLLVTHDIDEAVYMADRVVILSRPPSSVVETVSVNLPQERNQITTKELSEFAHLRAHVYRAIMDQHSPTSPSEQGAEVTPPFLPSSLS